MQKRYLYLLIIILGAMPTCLTAFSWSETKQAITNWISTKNTVTATQEISFKGGKQITLHNKRGSLTVTTWNKPTVLLETRKTGTAEELEKTTISHNTAQNTLTIETLVNADQTPAWIDYTLVIPTKIDLLINTQEGDISVAGAVGNIQLQTESGDINAEQISGTLHAKALNGSILIEQPLLNKNSEDASIFAEAHNAITLLMSENANASMRATTLKGTILSDIFITLDPITVQLTKESYKQMQRSIRGTTGMGGMPITLETTQGNIKIMGV